MSFPVVKNGGHSSTRRLSRSTELAKVSVSVRPRTQRPGRAARRRAAGQTGRARLRLLSRWVCICGHRKWLPKTARKLPVACRSRRSREMVAQIPDQPPNVKNSLLITLPMTSESCRKLWFVSVYCRYPPVEPRSDPDGCRSEVSPEPRREFTIFQIPISTGQ